MKRSRNIRLFFTSALAASALIGCSNPDDDVSADKEYQNNSYCSGAGYYHAPYHSWFQYPYNYYEPNRGYFHGGTWSSAPETPSITSSRPTAAAAMHASSAHASVSRGGFGFSGFHSSGT